jgi:hypothetical protein
MAQIEEGIPPDARNLFESHLFSFNQEKISNQSLIHRIPIQIGGNTGID